MRFDADNGDKGWVRDANGGLLPKPVRGDTETGEVVCIDQDGERKLKRFKPPLTITPMSEPKPLCDDAKELP
jgi:hypothetical protein